MTGAIFISDDLVIQYLCHSNSTIEFAATTGATVMHSKKPQEGNLYSCQILLEQNKKFQKSTMSISYQIFYKKNPQKNI